MGEAEISDVILPTTHIVRERASRMWLRLGSRFDDLVAGSDDWLSDSDSSELQVMKWAELAEQCYLRAVQQMEAGRDAPSSQDHP